MDFLHDEPFDGRRIRLLTVVDNFSRVSPMIGVRRSSHEQQVNRFFSPEVVQISESPQD